MKLERLPGIDVVFRASSPDRVFDLLMLAGPVILLFIAVAGRTPWTTALATAYVGALVGYVGAKGVDFSARRQG